MDSNRMNPTLFQRKKFPTDRWHPLAAGVSGFFFIIGLAQSDSLLTITGFLFFVYIGYVFLGVRSLQVFQTFRYFVWMLPVTFLVHLLCTEKGIGFFRNLLEGIFILSPLSEAALFTLKIFGFFYVMGGLFQLIRSYRVLDSLSQIARQLQRRGIHVSAVIQIVHLAIRFLPLLQQEARHLQDVRKGLGVAEQHTMSGRIRSQVRSLTPLFIGTLHRGEVLAQTMHLRGFRADKIRTIYQHPSWRTRDTVLVFVALSVTTLLFVL